MNLRRLLQWLLLIAQAGAVLYFSHYGQMVIAALVVAAPVVWRWQRNNRRSGALALLADLIPGLGVVCLIGLSRGVGGALVLPVATQIVLAIAYAGWLLWRRQHSTNFPVLANTIIGQIFGVTTIFLVATFWEWPAAVVVAGIWLVSYLVAWRYFFCRAEPAAHLLAATWGLIAAEISWVLHVWLVAYVVAGGYLIIPQATLIVLGAGYCFLHIYLAHASKHLSRRRLLEYITIGGVMLTVVIAGTRWSGVT